MNSVKKLTRNTVPVALIAMVGTILAGCSPSSDTTTPTASTTTATTGGTGTTAPTATGAKPGATMETKDHPAPAGATTGLKGGRAD